MTKIRPAVSTRSTVHAPAAATSAKPASKSAQPKATGTVTIGGKAIARLAKPPTAPTKISQQLVNFFFDTSIAALGSGKGLLGLAKVPIKCTDWRTASYAKTAMATPLAKDPAGQPAKIGDLTIMRPGLGNIGFSAAQVFRTAQYSGKVVVAYTGRGEGAERTLRPAKEIEGVPVPKELQGKVFVIGEPEHNLISYQQSSDVFLEQLEAMRQAKSKLGVDPLEGHATVIGHSQGGLDAVLTRKRLEAAGFPDAIGRLVTVGSPFKGSDCADNLLGLVGAGLSATMDRDDGFAAIRQLDPDETRKWFKRSDEKYVDLAYRGQISGTPEIRARVGIPPFEIEDPNNLRLSMRLVSLGGRLSEATGSLSGLLGLLKDPLRGSDGLVPTSSAKFGVKQRELKMPYDHIGMIEDFHVIDQIAGDVARP